MTINKELTHLYHDYDLYYEKVKSENSSWCPVPWGQVTVHNSGEYRICPQSRTCPKTRGLLTQEDGKQMRADTHTMDEVRNAPLYKELRKSMMEGKQHSVCKRCNQEDDLKMASRRRNAIREYYDRYNFDIYKAQSATMEDGTLVIDKSPVLEYDIRIGNLCNLRCKMCNPGESTKWYDEWMDTMFDGFKSDFTRLEFEKVNGKAKLKNDIYTWYDDSNFYSELYKNSSNLRKIYLSGGEPTLVENLYDILQKFIDDGLAKDIELEYNINLTNVPRRSLPMWHEFKSVTLGGSIDGVGKTNDYIRYPSKWEKIEENVRWLDENSGPNINLFNTVTWQVLNAIEILDIVKWQINGNFKKLNRTVNSVFFSMHFLHSPLHMNVKCLPKELKQHVQNEFEKFDNEFLKPWYENLATDFSLPNKDYEADWNLPQIWDQDKEKFYLKFKDKMRAMLEFMWSEDLSEHFNEFVIKNNKQDEYRNQQLKDYSPWISKYIEENNNG
jgi:hypothetical protein